MDDEPRPDWPAPLPADVQVTRHDPDRGLNLSQMPDCEKRATWAQIKTRNPALAQLLKDPDLQALRDAFGADVMIDPEALD
jgi:hypothetical protein